LGQGAGLGDRKVRPSVIANSNVRAIARRRAWHADLRDAQGASIVAVFVCGTLPIELWNAARRTELQRLAIATVGARGAARFTGRTGFALTGVRGVCLVRSIRLLASVCLQARVCLLAGVWLGGVWLLASVILWLGRAARPRTAHAHSEHEQPKPRNAFHVAREGTTLLQQGQSLSERSAFVLITGNAKPMAKSA
jgi:hypothetical protein